MKGAGRVFLTRSLLLSRDIERAIFQNENIVAYFDVESKVFHVIRDDKFQTATKLDKYAPFTFLPLDETILTGSELWHEELLHHYAYFRYIDNLAYHPTLYKLAEEEAERVKKWEKEVERKKTMKSLSNF